MKDLNENNFYIQVLEFGEKYPEWFTYNELKEYLQIRDNDYKDKIIKSYLFNALTSGAVNESIWVWNGHGYITDTVVTPVMDSMFFVIEKSTDVTNLENHKFILKYDAYFNYIDYRELKEALKSSKDAKIIAIISIIIAIITWLFQISKDSFLLNFICNLF